MQQSERQWEGLLEVQASATDEREVKKLKQPLELRANLRTPATPAATAGE